MARVSSRLFAASTHVLPPPLTTAFIFERLPKRTIELATVRSPGSAELGHAADGRGGGVSAETPMLAMVAEQPVYNDGRFSYSAMPAQDLRRVNLTERQRDQRESAAVSSARAPQHPRPIPAPRCRR